jgi:SAM-dependent methyltransferase
VLINYQEYQAMFEVEDQMWWYKSLHERVIEEVKLYSNHCKSLKILDAGCGTGGLLTKLKQEGIVDIEGFDFNEDAVAFSQSRGLKVSKQDITAFAHNYENDGFDVVISNDVLYQFEDVELMRALNNIYRVLKPGGIFISNNQAFPIFSGIHDIAVGSKRRFVKRDFDRFIAEISGFSLVKHSYWSLFLAPVILTVRLLQRLQLKLGMVKMDAVKSDVSMPSKLLNAVFNLVNKAERSLLKQSPFGSSLFMVILKSSSQSHKS